MRLPSARSCLLCGALGSLAGCGFTPNAYQVPRTIAPGTLQVGVSLDSVAAANPRWDHVPKSGLQVRYGVHKRMDLSASTTLPASYTLGWKLHAVKSDRVDIAWLVRGNVTRLQRLRVDYSDLADIRLRCPVAEQYCQGEWLGLFEVGPLVGLNLGRDLTFVASGALYTRLSTPRRSGFRVGFGVQWRVTEDVALMPEFTFLPGLSPLNERTVFYGVAILSRGADGYAKK
jgi:hypothetical protein